MIGSFGKNALWTSGCDFLVVGEERSIAASSQNLVECSFLTSIGTIHADKMRSADVAGSLPSETCSIIHKPGWRKSVTLTFKMPP